MIGRRRVLCGLAAAATVVGLSGFPPLAAVAATAPAPAVKSVSPSTGALGGGTTVTVTGSGFSHVSKILFGTTTGTRLKVSSSTKLTIVAPRHAAGTVDVRVVTVNGRVTRTSAATIHDHFTYDAPPSVSGVSPNTGSLNGGTTITVTGAHFLSLSRVLFGSAAVTKIHTLSSTKLTVVAPKHVAGTVDIRITGKYGTSAVTARDRYSYVDTTPPPPITGLKVTATATSTISLSWTDPSSSEYAGVVIRRATGTTPPSSPTSGTSVTSAAAPASKWTDTGLTAGTTYSYALFAHNKANYYAKAATVTGSTAKPACTPVVRDVSGTLTANTTWTPACTSAYVIDSGVDVLSGVTLTITAGTVIKYGQDSTTGIMVYPGGSLTVSGTAQAPVVFTSTSGAPGQYGDAIHLGTDAGQGGTGGASVNVQHAVFQDGTDAINDAFTYCCTDEYDGNGSLSVSDSDFAEAVYIGGEIAAVTFTDDTFGSGVVIGSSQVRQTMKPEFTSDTFHITGTTQFGSGGDVEFVQSDLTGVVLSGPGANAFTGSVTGNRLYLDGSDVPAGGSWTLTSAGGAEPVIGGVDVQGSMTIAAGTVLKYSENSALGILVYPGGSLTVSGTAQAPAVFTSLEDGSVGGNTSGGSTEGAPGQYGDAIHLGTHAGQGGTGAPSVTVEHAVFRDGTDAISDQLTYCCTDQYDGTGNLSVSDSDIAEAIYVGGETATDIFSSDTIHDTAQGLTIKAGKASFRGSFSNVSNAITACDWGDGCSVDATYTSWNDSAAGPFPQGASSLVCGAVQVTPWTGQNGTSTLFGSANCDGSATPVQQVSTASKQFDEDLDGVEVQCGDGYQDFCAEAQNALACLSAAEGLAEANSPVPLTSEQTAEDFASEASDKLSDYLAGSADAVVSTIGQVTGFAGQILGVVGIFTSLASAYNQCDP